MVLFSKPLFSFAFNIEMLKQLNPFSYIVQCKILGENELLEMQEEYRLRQLPEKLGAELREIT